MFLSKWKLTLGYGRYGPRFWAENFGWNLTQCISDMGHTMCAYDGWMDMFHRSACNVHLDEKFLIPSEIFYFNFHLMRWDPYLLFVFWMSLRQNIGMEGDAECLANCMKINISWNSAIDKKWFNFLLRNFFNSHHLKGVIYPWHNRMKMFGIKIWKIT